MTNLTYGVRLPRLAAGLSFGLLMAASGYSQAGEITPQTTNGVQHFFDCFGAMLNNGQAHGEYCSPGNAAGPGNSSLGSFSGGAEPTCVPLVMLDRTFDAVHVASLGPDLYVDAPTLRMLTFAQSIDYCCDKGELDAPAFVTYQTASLDESIGSELQTMGHHPAQMVSVC